MFKEADYLVPCVLKSDFVAVTLAFDPVWDFDFAQGLGHGTSPAGGFNRICRLTKTQ